MKKPLLRKWFFQLNLPLRASEILLRGVKLLRSEIFATANVANLISLDAIASNFTMTAGHYFIFGIAEYFTKIPSSLLAC